MIAGCIGEILLDSQVPFRGLNRCMPERDLDLLKRGMPPVRKLCESPPEIVRREIHTDPVAVLLHSLEDRLRRHALAHNPAALIHGPQ